MTTYITSLEMLKNILNKALKHQF